MAASSTKLLIYTFLACASIVLSQTHDIITERYANGMKKKIMVYEGEGRNEVLIEILFYFDTGQLKSEIKIIDGKKNGEFKVYYEDGSIESTSTYKNDKPVGDEKLFYKSGALKGQIKYEEFIPYDLLDLLLSIRIEDDLFRFLYLNNSTSAHYYYNSGIDSCISSENNGILDVVEFYQSGQKKREYHYNKNADLIEYLTTYQTDGTIIERQFYGDKNTKIEYYNNGNRKSEKLYDDLGNLCLVIDYYEHGDTCYIRNYKNNELNGYYYEYDLLGKPIVKTEYLDGKKHGEYIWYRYDENGNRTVREKGQHIKGLREGKWYRYKVSGEERISDYDSGVDEFDLNGISWLGNNGYALVNESILSVGDSYGGYIVTEITQNSVTFRSGEKELIIESNEEQKNN